LLELLPDSGEMKRQGMTSGTSSGNDLGKC
jgi:hypothetical protein